MPIVGFNFIKINIERKGKFIIPEQIKSDLKVTDIIQEQLPVGKSEEVINFSFEFSIDYGSAGSALLTGNVLYLDEPAKVKHIVEDWKKEKKMPTDIISTVLNTILFKCNIKALNLSQEVNLPPHFKLPIVSPLPNSSSSQIKSKEKELKETKKTPSAS